MLIKYRAWSGAIGHMLFDFGIANLSLVGYFFKKWQSMSLMISILPFSKAILICPSVSPSCPSPRTSEESGWEIWVLKSRKSLFIFCFFLPKSIQFLYSRGKYDEGRFYLESRDQFDSLPVFIRTSGLFKLIHFSVSCDELDLTCQN